MEFQSSVTEKIIFEEKDGLSDLIRYCISDKVPCNILDVLRDNSPAKYAQDISKSCGEKIFDKFNNAADTTISREFKQAWTFDRLVEAGSLLRIAEVRKTQVKDAKHLLKALSPYMLVIDTPDWHVGKYAGLVGFSDNIKTSFEENSVRRDTHSIGTLDRLLRTVGSLENKQWFLHNPLWNKTLNSTTRGLFIIKAFLHAAMLSHTVSDKTCEELLEVSRDDVVRDVEHFIDLVEDPNTDSRDIRRFLNQVEHYTTDVPTNRIAAVAFTRSYENFKEEHHRAFGDRFENSFRNILPEEFDSPEWIFLRGLGEECSAEMVIVSSDETPLTHTEFLTNNHLTDLYNSPFIDQCRKSNISIPEMFPKSLRTIKCAIADRVYKSLVKRRFMNMRNNDSELSEQYVCDRSSILLVIEDPEDQMKGLSLVSDLLNFHRERLKETFTEREYLLLAWMENVWNGLKMFSKPNKMDKTWKSYLSDPEHRRYFRQFFFKVLEALYLEKDEEFLYHFDMTRYEFSSCTETFCILLSHKADKKSLNDFFESVPELKSSINVNEWDQMIWLAPYNYIPK